MNAWSLVYEGFDPAQERLREALGTLGNGHFATRGAVAFAEADAVHYPGTYLAGGYNRLTSEINGHTVENEDLVNLPNWLPLTFRIGEEPWFNLQAVTLLGYRQELDLQRGILAHSLRFRDAKGREMHALPATKSSVWWDRMNITPPIPRHPNRVSTTIPTRI